MQRINWFPDPNITGTVKLVANNKTKVECPVVVNSRNWLRATSTATGDNYAQYILVGSQLPPAGSYHVHALAYAQGAQASFQVFYRIGSSYKQPFSVPVGNGQTVIVDKTITLPAGCDQMLVRLQLDATTVGAIGMMSNIIIESANTYDNAVGGGASGLLHGRHDATRLTPCTGTVVPDDGHEPMHEPILDHRPESRQVGGYHDHSEKARDEILGQSLCERHRRHYLDERVWRHQCKPTCRLRANRQRCQSDVNELFRQVRQSDRHRDQYAHLHVGRVSGEQDPARRHRIFHRGHDAARLTLTGVMA
ncbi:Uncharacterised protein [Bifidobacterium catenulatum]|nr:hypothetical protein [Bifidobacterium catenulatum]VUX34034.1 Uncharacterised protein [Bifidobacterium catenulatum]